MRGRWIGCQTFGVIEVRVARYRLITAAGWAA